MICASCVFCCCCFALDFFSSLHSFFIVVSFWIFRTFFSSFVWGLPVLLCCRCVCVFFFRSRHACAHNTNRVRNKSRIQFIYLMFFFCSSFTLALVSYFLSVIIITTFLFVASVCNTHKTVCVYIFFSAHFEEF